MLRGLNYVQLLGQVELGSNFTIEDFANVSSTCFCQCTLNLDVAIIIKRIMHDFTHTYTLQSDLSSAIANSIMCTFIICYFIICLLFVHKTLPWDNSFIFTLKELVPPYHNDHFFLGTTLSYPFWICKRICKWMCKWICKNFTLLFLVPAILTFLGPLSVNHFLT